jgi:hypothetical protein
MAANNSTSFGDDDNFGLPDLNPKPWDTGNNFKPRGNGQVKLIVGLLIAVVLLGGGYLYYHFQYQVPRQRAAELAEKNTDGNAAGDQSKTKKAAQRDSGPKAQGNAKPAAGAIVELTQRTGQYYVVVASCIDKDLMMDYAKKLSSTGVGTYVIPPNRIHQFNRLAVASATTFDEATTVAKSQRDVYGDAVWVVRY